jgi:hypothetical protein
MKAALYPEGALCQDVAAGTAVFKYQFHLVSPDSSFDVRCSMFDVRTHFVLSGRFPNARLVLE